MGGCLHEGKESSVVARPPWFVPNARFVAWRDSRHAHRAVLPCFDLEHRGARRDHHAQEVECGALPLPPRAQRRHVHVPRGRLQKLASEAAVQGQGPVRGERRRDEHRGVGALVRASRRRHGDLRRGEWQGARVSRGRAHRRPRRRQRHRGEDDCGCGAETRRLLPRDHGQPAHAGPAKAGNHAPGDV